MVYAAMGLAGPRLRQVVQGRSDTFRLKVER
jgi:hypothetical protein